MSDQPTVHSWLKIVDAWIDIEPPADRPMEPARFVIIGIRSDGKPYSATGTLQRIELHRSAESKDRAEQETRRFFDRYLRPIKVPCANQQDR